MARPIVRPVAPFTAAPLSLLLASPLMGGKKKEESVCVEHKQHRPRAAAGGGAPTLGSPWLQAPRASVEEGPAFLPPSPGRGAQTCRP